MADSNYTFKDASGTTNTHDARTEATNGEKRAVVVIGDPSVNAAVGEVLNSAPAGTEYGQVVREVNAAATKTALEVIDDWDESDRAKVNPIVGQAGVAAGAGAVSATVQRTTLASDDPAVAKLGTIDTDTGNIADGVGLAADAAATAGSVGTLSAKLRLLTTQLDAVKTAVEALDNAVAGSELQVDVVGALPAGTNNIGDVDILSIAAGTNNIGDVDVLTVPADPFGANADAAATAGSTGSMQAKLRLVTSQLDSIKTAVETLDNAISGSEMQVDIVGALPAGTNAIGKLAANSGVDIGDADITSVVPGTGATNLGKAEDGGHTGGDVGVMALGVRQDTPNTALTGTDLDYTPPALSSTGAMRNAPISEDFAALANGPQVKKYYTNAGAVTDGIIWSPAAGKRWYVTDIFVGVSAAATVTIEDDKAGGDEAVWKMELAANSGWAHSFTTPWFSGEDAADLLITTTAGNVYVTVVGYEI